MKKILILSVLIIIITGCKTVSKKVDEASIKETEKLNKFLNKTESDLKIEFGKPDFIETGVNENKIFVYYDAKFKIKCERRFEINSKNIVVAFSSKNCF
ncbi:MAG: hypothetical protein CMI79_01040 [Candidatus Pelagibacter sp.]|nr:hypothetical protein [Candidatus Pelagibacter sp.]|tara:strand:- start:1968 stop:2264 length:297 start_codon:yes stop_codon:yes gene_type:complete